ncbi:MAG: 2-octaprenyl-6-methoxyphenyl hydroxylase [Gammaproteobacteria bacterium]|nr:2-octaprenyl-6-methoxyphenyl hydroxylase [Gammaproteobacteria bacterium]MYD77320.1 2-octaprenyl-6-methoxyphenyl hydroxylase [Gammaproteobacteria bacterium]MYJ52519.1 2-octaprenyl-6-methoxyphenyl hydroxylase [Gammaproteobacteria bacterium]
MADRREPDAAHYDIVIAGGGLCGASLACALVGSKKRVLVVEPVEIESDLQPTWDERTVALTYCSRNVFSALGVWERIERNGAQPILDIHVSSRGGFGQTHLSCNDAGTEALGYVVPVRELGAVLWETIRQSPEIELECPGSVVDADMEEECCRIGIDRPGGRIAVTAGLLVVADGGRSDLAGTLGIPVREEPYDQSAVLCIVGADRPHCGRAYERFTPNGPLALLPHRIDGGSPAAEACHFALVWTTRDSDLEERMSLDDAGFVDALQSAFGGRAGNFSGPSERKSYPLTRFRVDSPASGRAVLLGNAAHTVHPVAGQGFNLGLRDVACLAELICESGFAPGSEEMAREYIRLRRRDAWMVESFTHSLIRVFSSPVGPVSAARNAGLVAIEHFPPAKRLLLRQTMGLEATPFKLTSGIPIGS